MIFIAAEITFAVAECLFKLLYSIAYKVEHKHIGSAELQGRGGRIEC